MVKEIIPVDDVTPAPDFLPDRSDLSKVYERDSRNSHMREPIPRLTNYTASNFFKSGILISLAPAILFTVFLHLRNNGLDTLLLFFCFDIVLILACIGVSYRTARNFSYSYQLLKISFDSLIFAYLIIVCGIARILYLVFIHYEIAFAYLLLPIGIVSFSAVIFLLLVEVSSGKYSTFRSTLLTYFIAALFLIPILFIR